MLTVLRDVVLVGAAALLYRLAAEPEVSEPAAV
jgi:hypothetical protein